MTKHPKKLRVEAARLYRDEGLSQAEVAQRLGIGKTTVQRWRTELGIPSRSRQSKRPEELRVEAARLYRDEGLSAKAVGERLGVSRDTVRRWLKELGVERRARRYPEELRVEAARLYQDEGLTMAVIAQRLDVAESTVRAWLKAFDVSPSDSKHRGVAGYLLDGRHRCDRCEILVDAPGKCEDCE